MTRRQRHEQHLKEREDAHHSVVQPKEQNRGTPQNQTAEEKRIIPPPISPPTSTPKATTMPPTISSNKSPDEHKEFREKWKFRIEVAGVVVLAAYTMFTILIWHQTKRSVDAVEKQLIAMQAANRLTQDNLFLVNSPRIYCTKARLRPPVVGKPIIIDTEFRNAGPLAAEKFGVSATIEIRRSEPDVLNASAEGKHLAELNPIISMAYATSSAFPLDRRQYDSINRGEMKIYFHGSLQYENPMVPENADPTKSPRVPGAIDVKMFCFFYDPKIGPDPIACEHWISSYRIVPRYNHPKGTPLSKQ